VVTLDDNYPPYAFRDATGALTGYLVDYWKLWEQRTGVHVDLQASDWGQAQARMGSHQADVIDTIFETSERQKTLDFTPPYATIPVSIYSHVGIGGISDLQHLKGFVVGVKAGDACIDNLKSGGVTTIQPYVNYESLVKAAIAGQVRIFCLDEPSGQLPHVPRTCRRHFQ
jgi:ABC-type amino acid transport substrate-binding protein